MAIKNLIIRADASVEIGTGHVMRCLTLANSLRDHDCSVTFICRELSGNLCDFIEQQDFPVWRLPDDLQDLDETWQSETDRIISILNQQKIKIDWLIIDHYRLDNRWERALRPFVQRIMVIDDLANRSHDSDLLLDQNFYYNFTTRYQNLVPSSCLQLLGLDYLMLRSEFTEQSERPIKQVKIAKNLLITMGGSDHRNITCWLLEILKYIQIPLSIKIAVGAGCPHFDKIINVANTVNLHHVTIERSVPNISDWMIWADLAICSGGFTSYELAFMGVPTLVISTSPTQLEAATTLHSLGMTKFIGEFGTLSIDKVVEFLKDILFDSKELMKLSQNAKAKIDGHGVKRVVEKIL